MAGKVNAVLRQQAPEIDQIGADQDGIFRKRQGLAPRNTVDRLINTKNKMIGIGGGNAQGTPAHATPGIKNDRRLRVESCMRGQRSSEGCTVVIEYRLAKRMIEVALQQSRQVLVRSLLRTADEA